jgi:hypothetical protein
VAGGLRLARFEADRSEGKVMGGTGRELVRFQANSVVEEIASAYLIRAGGNASVALRKAIGDALADLVEMDRRSRRAERLISRGFVRCGSPNARTDGLGALAASTGADHPQALPARWTDFDGDH